MRRGQSPKTGTEDDEEDSGDWGDTFAVLASVYGFTPGEVGGFSYGQARAYIARAGLMEKRRGDAHAQSLVPIVNSLFVR